MCSQKINLQKNSFSQKDFRRHHSLHFHQTHKEKQTLPHPSPAKKIKSPPEFQANLPIFQS
jgi:hypothetical protein